MQSIDVNTQALTFSADRLGDAADATRSLRLDVPLGGVPTAMPGSASAIAADLARTAWIEHATRWTRQADAQVDAMRAAALTYGHSDSTVNGFLAPAPETVF